MQNCRLFRKNRKWDPDVWLLRWSDKSNSAKRIYRKRVIGTVEEYPAPESVRRAVANLIVRMNAANPRIGPCSTTLSQLSNHFERIELERGNTWRRYSAKRSYAGYRKRRIVPQWEPTNCEISRQLRSNPGFDGDHLLRVVAPRFRGVISVLFNPPADTNCSTAIGFAWFVRTRNTITTPCALLPRRSRWRTVPLRENLPRCFSLHPPDCPKVNCLVCSGAISILQRGR